MSVSRRTLAQSLAIAGAIGLPFAARAQTGGPGEGSPTLAPEEFYDALLSAPLSTSLFPADLGELVITGEKYSGTDFGGRILIGSAISPGTTYGTISLSAEDPGPDSLNSVSEGDVSQFRIAGFDGMAQIYNGQLSGDPLAKSALTRFKLNTTLIDGFADGKEIMDVIARSFVYALRPLIIFIAPSASNHQRNFISPEMGGRRPAPI